MQENRLLNWLSTRGISPNVIELFNITVHEHYEFGECLRIPIEDTGLSKYRRDPAYDIKPKYTSDRGLKATLYGWNNAKTHKSILVTEGELDTLIAWSNNIPAVSSTAGARTFNEDWFDLLKDKEITLCFDNDEAGAEGMVRILQNFPQAKVVLIPNRPNIKDLTDYVKYGGNIYELLKTAKHYTSVEQVKEERALRISVFESVIFHDEYIDKFTPQVMPNSRPVKAINNSLKEQIKTYPIDNLITFHRRKVHCIWHSEKTASLTYNPKTNRVHCFGCGKHGDVIDVYRQLHGCDFTTAVNDLQKLI
jgi:hypothetical protein